MFAVFQYHWKHQAIREKGAESKLPASVHDILPPATARTDYAAGFQNLTVSYRTVFRRCSNGSKVVTDNSNYVSGVSFITAHVAYASTDKTKIVWIETELVLCPWRTRPMFTCMLWRGYVASKATVLLVPEPFGGRWQRRWTAEWRYRAPLQWPNQSSWQSLEEAAGKRCSECGA